MSGFQRRYETSLAEASRLRSFEADLPFVEEIVALRDRQRSCHVLYDRYVRATQTMSHYAGFSSAALHPGKVEAIPRKMEVVSGLLSRHREASALVGSTEEAGEKVLGELAQAEREVAQLLGERGVCPTCNTIHEGAHP